MPKRFHRPRALEAALDYALSLQDRALAKDLIVRAVDSYTSYVIHLAGAAALDPQCPTRRPGPFYDEFLEQEVAKHL